MQQQLVLNNAVIESACGCAADRDDESEEPPPEDQDFEEKLDVPRKNIILLAVLFTGVPPCSGHAAADAHGAQQPSLACGTLLYHLDILDMYWLTGHVSSSSTSALKWRHLPNILRHAEHTHVQLSWPAIWGRHTCSVLP